MSVDNNRRTRWMSFVSSALSLAFFLSQSLGMAAETTAGPTVLRPIIPTTECKRLTIEEAVSTAVAQYPRIMQMQNQLLAAEKGVTLQKINEYVPYGLVNMQEVAASHNKLTQVLFGSFASPANMGPGKVKNTFEGTMFSFAGFIVDWAPLDFGLHKARINVAHSQVGQAQANYAVTRLDIAETAANAFLNVIVAQEQVQATAAAVKNMTVFADIAHHLVAAGLKPGADASLADAQLAEARNGYIQATQNEKVAEADLAEAIGLGGTAVAIDPAPMVHHAEPPVITVSVPDYAAHPLAMQANSIISTVIAQRAVLDKSYYPTFHFLGGMNLRGAGLNTQGNWQAHQGAGSLPTSPNWNVGLMMNWNFLDAFSLHEQKVVNKYQIEAQRQHYNEIINQLKTQDVRSRAMIEGAIALANNVPVELQAAHDAEVRSRTRYQTGLATVAEVAQAEQLLMQAQVKMSVARVGVWKALLAMSLAHGDIKPFLAEVASARSRGM